MNNFNYAIAIPTHNDEHNIGHLFETLAPLARAPNPPVRIVVLSSASTDRTDKIVERAVGDFPIPVKFLSERSRHGVPHAVNRLMKELGDVDVIALVDADIIPEGDCITRLVEMFSDPKIGVAGGRPVPRGPDGNLAVWVSRLLWWMHHDLALSRPKTTEITVFRNTGFSLDETLLVEEAQIEHILSSQGYRVVYVPSARLLTNAPTTVDEYLEQRTRVTYGHMIIDHRDGYKMGTLPLAPRFALVARAVREKRFSLWVTAAAIVLETIVYVRAGLRVLLGRHIDPRWRRTVSTRRPFSQEEF